MCILIRSLRRRLTSCLPNFLKESPSSSMDTTILSCQESFGG